MSKVYTFDFEYDHDYILIGIHTVLEDYRLAYFLNQTLRLSLKRYKEDLDFPINKCSFPFYIFEDEASFISWSLISNKYFSNEKSNTDFDSLFEDKLETRYLIPEKNQVDFFLKINGNILEKKIQKVLTVIKNTNKVITSYTINPNSLKTRDNLIF